jgi:hypothetical protein
MILARPLAVDQISKAIGLGRHFRLHFGDANRNFGFISLFGKD